MTETLEPPGDGGESAERLLSDLREMRRAARDRRHAYWLPVLLFGLLVCASAPMYIQSLPQFTGNGGSAIGFMYADNLDLAALGGTDPVFGNVSPNVRGWYWLLALLVGALVTALWYGWHSTVTGVATRVRGTVLIWVGATLALIIVSVVSLELVFRAWPATDRGTLGLLVIAVGLVALAWVERSLLLAGICVVYTFAACVGVFYNPENQFYRLLTAFGVSVWSLPYNEGATINVLFPGVVLILGGLIAAVVDVRSR